MQHPHKPCDASVCIGASLLYDHASLGAVKRRGYLTLTGAHVSMIVQGQPDEGDDEEGMPHTSAPITTPVPHSKMLHDTDADVNRRTTDPDRDPAGTSSIPLDDDLLGSPGFGGNAIWSTAGGHAKDGKKSPPRKGSRRPGQGQQVPKQLSKWKSPHNAE